MGSIMINKICYRPLSKFFVFTVSACLSMVSATAAEDDNSESDNDNIVTIVGSHIKRAVDNEALPVTSISEEDITNLGVVTGDELLRSIPQIGEVQFGAATGNGGVNDARGDVSSINLRGVGTGNTLTLLNGRRLVTHPGTQSENFVPVSTVIIRVIPFSLAPSIAV